MAKCSYLENQGKGYTGILSILAKSGSLKCQDKKLKEQKNKCQNRKGIPGCMLTIYQFLFVGPSWLPDPVLWLPLQNLILPSL